MEDEKILAVVTRVVRHGRHGPYAVSYAKNSGIREEAVTFSLTAPCWEEKTLPERGVLVILVDVQRKRAGWRAGSARYVRSADADFITANERRLSDGKVQ